MPCNKDKNFHIRQERGEGWLGVFKGQRGQSGRKGPKRQKGVTNYLSGPFDPFSVAVAWHKRNRHKPSGSHNRISCQKGSDLVPSRNWHGWGCTWRTSPFGTMSLVPKMTPYHKKLMDEVLQRLHNITRVKNYSLGLGKDIEEEHIGR